MNQFARKLFTVSMLLSVVNVNANTVSGKSFFLPHAQNGTADAIFGQTGAIHKYDVDHFYGVFKSQTGYYQSFSNSKIGKYLFFNGTNEMNIGQRKTASANTDVDILNSQLLLSAYYTGTIQALPKVQTVVSSFDFFFGFNEWVDGLWFQAQLPLVWTKWNVHLTDLSATPSTNQILYANEYDASTNPAAEGVAQVPPLPYTSAAAAFRGDATYGDMTNTWQYGRVDGAQSKTKLGDCHLTLGYDFVSKENAHFGLGIHALLGAGGKSNAEYMFEPIVGYAGRFGVGGTIDTAVRLWERDEEHNFVAWLHGDVYTVFDNNQVRSFDLVEEMGGVGTRYNLVKKLTGVPSGTITYASEMDSMINVGTQTAKIGMSVAYDVTLMFIYQHGGFCIDFGYTAGGHSSEKFKSWVTSIEANTYVLWDQQLANAGTTTTAAQAISGTSSEAISGYIVDATQAAVSSSNYTTYIVDNSKLDTDSALAPSAFANVIFGGVNYCWMDNDWAPCLGGGASVEFSGNGNKTLDLWGIFLQGNVSF